MIEIKGFLIQDDGDPSVGNNPASWEFPGPFYFEDKEELKEFRDELKSLMQLQSECPYVETFEEIEEQRALEDKWIADQEEDQRQHDQYMVSLMNPDYELKKG
jgi:nitrate reductase assembly molybdenum cofactor insertion protein NarJ